MQPPSQTISFFSEDTRSRICHSNLGSHLNPVAVCDYDLSHAESSPRARESSPDLTTRKDVGGSAVYCYRSPASVVGKDPSASRPACTALLAVPMPKAVATLSGAIVSSADGSLPIEAPLTMGWIGLSRSVDRKVGSSRLAMFVYKLGAYVLLVTGELVSR